MLSHTNLMLGFVLLFHCLECLKWFVSNPEDFELLGHTWSSVTLPPRKCFQQNCLGTDKRVTRVALSVSAVGARTCSPSRASQLQDCFFLSVLGKNAACTFKFSSILAFCCVLEKWVMTILPQGRCTHSFLCRRLGKRSKYLRKKH